MCIFIHGGPVDMCVCMDVCVYVYGHVCTCVYEFIHGDLISKVGIILSQFPPYFSKQGLSLKPELTKCAVYLANELKGYVCFCLPFLPPRAIVLLAYLWAWLLLGY